jgi:formaldehyde-activating enzyme
MSMYIGEALCGDGNEVAHIDLLLGSKDGPVGWSQQPTGRACPEPYL